MILAVGIALMFVVDLNLKNISSGLLLNTFSA